MSEKLTLTEVIELVVAGKLEDVRVSLPGRVVSYDRATQRADIQLSIKDRITDELNRPVAKTIPVLTDVPVMFYGAGSYWTTFPLTKGDEVLVVFCSSSMRTWRSTGGSDIDPGNSQRHRLSDAVAYAGVRAKAIAGVPDSAYVVNVPTGATIKLGGPTAAQSILRGEQFVSTLTTLLNSISTAVGGIAGGTAAATAITTAIGVFTGQVAGFLSVKGKVE